MLIASSDLLPPPSRLPADERLDLDDGRWEDVHVITGALKLFFRELPEPLFPFSHFRQFIAAISERLGEAGRMGLGWPGLAPAPPRPDPPPPTGTQPLVPLAEPTLPSLPQSYRTRPSAAAVCGTWCARCPPPTTTRCGCSSSTCAGEPASRAGVGRRVLVGPPRPLQLWALIPPSPLPGRRVIEHGDQNRMSVQSVAIVFGPTLLRPETEETSMPMTMVFQNQVVELILQRCSDIFPPH